jgi:hypothetical protein
MINEGTQRMDTAVFDGLTRKLAGGASRRALLRSLGALSAGGALATFLGAAESDARRKRKKNKKRKKKQNAGPICSDGIKNGSESDVDCGGTCPRCADGKTCTSRSDCANALCVAGACQSCVNGADCGFQADGVTPCFCRDNLRFPGTRACTNQNGRLLPPGSSCADCAANEACNPAGADIECVLFCGAV